VIGVFMILYVVFQWVSAIGAPRRKEPSVTNAGRSADAVARS
jgi:hypothetical protein